MDAVDFIARASASGCMVLAIPSTALQRNQKKHARSVVSDSLTHNKSWLYAVSKMGPTILASSTSSTAMIFLLLWWVTETVVISAAAQDADVKFDGCSVNEYYAGIVDWSSPAELTALLQRTHQQILPYTDSDLDDDDVWKALIDLDRSPENSLNVQLIYKQQSIAALPHGTSDTWNREHLWPQSRGVGEIDAAFTDVHHLRPADWNVNAARNNNYFADCTVYSNDIEECEIPAHPEAAADTAQGSDETFLPPAVVRGDIARALFYMAVRYRDEGLRLTDCPSLSDDDNNKKMAYLSQLLQWHADDPVDAAEEQRNQRACERWQGNRNPFVDDATLVEPLFGKPAEYPYVCDDTVITGDTPAPAAPTTQSPAAAAPSNNNKASSCSDLAAGDILFVTVNSDNPDTVAMVTLVDLDAAASGIDLYLTDNAYTTTDGPFLDNEGVIRLSVSIHMTAGTVFGYSSSGEEASLLHASDWSSVSGTFALAAAGDNLFLYCLVDDGVTTNFLAGLSTSASDNDWVYDADDTSTSALPSALTSLGALSLSHMDNYGYGGSVTGSKTQLQTQLLNASNWKGSNTVAAAVPTSPFVVANSDDNDNDNNNNNNNTNNNGSLLLAPGDVMVVGVQSDNPDLVALLALADISAGTWIHVTDNAWNGSAFRTNEGTVSLRVPATIQQGTVFGYGSSNLLYGNQWESKTDAGFSLSASGDTVLVYWTNGDGAGIGNPNHLSGLSFKGDWMPAGQSNDEYATDSSALPAELLQGDFSTSLPLADKYAYVGSMTGTKTSIQAALSDPNNWESPNGDVFYFGEDQPSKSKIFEIQNETSVASGPAIWLGFILLFVLLQSLS